MSNIVHRVVCTLTSIFSTLLEILLSVVLTGLFAPTLLILYTLNLLIRSVIQLIFKCRPSLNLQLISDGADGIWSYRKYGNSRNIIIVYIYSHIISTDKIQHNYDKCVINFKTQNGNKPYQKLRQIFTQKFGYFCWKDDVHFDIKNHVKNIFPESELITESKLKEFLPQLTADMDESKPQWEELIIPRYHHDSDDKIIKSARIYRSHHAYMDGCSNLLMTGTCMGDPDIKFPYIIDPTSPLKTPAWKILFYDLTCALLAAKTVLKNLYEASQIKSRFLMKNYSGRQLLAWSEPIRMGILKETKDATRTSIPSIFSSVCVKALGTLEESEIENLKSAGNSPKGMSIGLVGAVLPYGDIAPKNRFTVVNFNIKGNTPNGKRIERLKKTHKEFLGLTHRPDGLVNYKMFQIFGKFPAFVVQFMLKKAGTPVIYSNTPWATERVKLWGDEVKDVFGWMPLLTTAGIGLLTVSYCDSFRFCVIADESCLTRKELDFLNNEIYNEIHILHKESKEMIGPLIHRKGLLPV